MVSDRVDQGDSGKTHAAESSARLLHYEAWNDGLLHHFFNTKRVHRRVRLSIDEETLAQIGGSERDLAAAAVSEANRLGFVNIQELGINLCRSWRESVRVTGVEPPGPPFLAVLVIFVIAVNHGGEAYSPHSYYERLHDLLGSPSAYIKSIEPSLPLWTVLEEWSSRRTGGRFGFFEASARGRQAYVGIPRRQALLAPQEDEPLRQAFAAAGLRPGTDPGDVRLVAASRDAAGLLTRTKRLLRKWPGDEVAREILDEVRARFDEWEGIAPVDVAAAGSNELLLRLVLHRQGRSLTGGHFETDPVAGVTDQERCLSVGHMGAPAPSGSLWLQTGEDSGRPLVVDDNSDPAWAQPAQWFVDLGLVVEESGYVLVRRATRFLLCKQRGDGLLEEIDERDLVQGCTYLMLCQGPPAPEVPPRFRGVHSDWLSSPGLAGVLHRAVRMTESSGGPSGVRRTLRLTGGILSGAGRFSFMSFAPPSVTVVDPDAKKPCALRVRQFDAVGRELGTRNLAIENAHLLTDELELDAGVGETRATIPSLSPGTCVCELEAQFDDGTVQDIRFFIEHSPTSTDYVAPMTRDGLGEPISDNVQASSSARAMDDNDSRRQWSIGAHSRKPVRTARVFEDTAGQLLMRLLRARGTVTWQRAKEWLPRCLQVSTVPHGYESVYLVDQVLALHSLAILELEENLHGGLDRLLAIPPAITLLPRLANLGLAGRSGLCFSHEAVLVGCWLPEELAKMERAARRSGLELVVLLREEGVPLAPHRRSLLIEGEYVMERLQRVASESGVRFLGPAPLACKLVTNMGSLGNLNTSAAWRPGMPAGVYVKRFFDPRSLGVVRDDSVLPDRFLLCECRERSWWRFFIIDRETERHLKIHDRQLGRWFVRRQALPNVPVPVSDGDLFVPFELRLPKFLERAIVMCSGRAPRLKRFKSIVSPFSEPSVSDAFCIPPPPEQAVDWLASRTHCTGNFCCYAEAFDNEVWRRERPMPLLNALARPVRGLGLES